MKAIQTVRVGMASYGPYNDGRHVFDALHLTDSGQFFLDRGFCSDREPVLERELSRAEVESRQIDQGWFNARELLAIISTVQPAT